MFIKILLVVVAKTHKERDWKWGVQAQVSTNAYIAKILHPLSRACQSCLSICQTQPKYQQIRIQQCCQYSTTSKIICPQNNLFLWGMKVFSSKSSIQVIFERQFYTFSGTKNIWGVIGAWNLNPLCSFSRGAPILWKLRISYIFSSASKCQIFHGLIVFSVSSVPPINISSNRSDWVQYYHAKSGQIWYSNVCTLHFLPNPGEQRLT